MSKLETVYVADTPIGTCRVTGADMFWLLASFEPSPAFFSFVPLRLQASLIDQIDEAEEADDSEGAQEELSDLNMDLVDEINALELRLGDSRRPLRDFKVTYRKNGQLHVEFKLI